MSGMTDRFLHDSRYESCSVNILSLPFEKAVHVVAAMTGPGKRRLREYQPQDIMKQVGDMQGNIPCQCINGANIRLPKKSLARFLLGVFVFCIALPLAFCEVIMKGGYLFLRLLMGLSFTFCVWFFLVAVVFLLAVVFSVQLAAASMG